MSTDYHLQQEKLRCKEEARQKEDERKRAKEEEKMKRKENKKKGAKKTPPVKGWEEFVQGVEVPLFIVKCVSFIEAEGLDSEGIYRVPGNKVHVELLTQAFREDPDVSFPSLDVPVNAAATALKDYLKSMPPVLPHNNMELLASIAGICDRSCRLLRFKELLASLAPVNCAILKYIIQHFVRVAEQCKVNSMDSKNLAICWWPTLFNSMHFIDIAEFESHRPHVETIVQTFIDQFPFLFLDKEDYVMV